jgi:hypothetical protein
MAKKFFLSGKSNTALVKTGHQLFNLQFLLSSEYNVASEGTDMS